MTAFRPVHDFRSKTASTDDIRARRKRASTRFCKCSVTLANPALFCELTYANGQSVPAATFCSPRPAVVVNLVPMSSEPAAPTKSPLSLIALRLDTDSYERLRLAAVADQRPVGQMARKIVLDWLDQNPDPKETT